MYLYKKEMLEQFKFPFKGLEKIEQSYSQALQDMFVLAATDGKENGIFLEIGAYHPTSLSNTYLLEKLFGWDGVGIDISMIYGWEAERTASLVITDATMLDYKSFLDMYSKFKGCAGRIDYLQIDIEPSTNTFKCLKRMPLDQYRFSVITYETDVYDTAIPKETLESIRTESRHILGGYGYILVNGNVENAGNDPFEDWYLDSEYFPLETINKFKRDTDVPMRAKDYMLEGIPG